MNSSASNEIPLKKTVPTLAPVKSIPNLLLLRLGLVSAEDKQFKLHSFRLCYSQYKNSDRQQRHDSTAGLASTPEDLMS